MKYLVIYCHPNPKSFNHAISETVVNALQGKQHEVRVRDLYELNFDPILKGSDFESFQKGKSPEDIRLEQEQIQWAQTIVFVFPIWWTGMPARMKGYIDRVFSYGFAYRVEKDGIKGLLTDKKVFIFNTTGTPENIYAPLGMFKSINQVFEDGIFKFCGITLAGHKYFTAVPSITDEQRKQMLAETKKIVEGL